MVMYGNLFHIAPTALRSKGYKVAEPVVAEAPKAPAPAAPAHTSLESVVGIGGRQLAGEEHTKAKVPEVSRDAAPEAPEPKAETGDVQSAKPAPVEIDHAEPQDNHPVPRKALIEERRKRQERERELAEARGQLSVYQNQAQPKAKEATEDPQAQFYGNPTEYIDKRLSAETSRMRMEMSIEMMRAAHPDYGEKEAAFIEAAKANPALVQQLNASPNPARFAYDTGKIYSEVKGAGTLDELRANIEKDVRQKIEEEYRKKGALTAAEQASTSSVGARGNGANSAAAWSGPTPLNQIFKGSFG